MTDSVGFKARLISELLRAEERPPWLLAPCRPRWKFSRREALPWCRIPADLPGERLARAFPSGDGTHGCLTHVN